jgi:hypothetical protein
LVGDPTKGEGLWKTKTFFTIDGGRYSVPTHGSFSDTGEWVGVRRVYPQISVDSSPLVTEFDGQLWNAMLNLNFVMNNEENVVTPPLDPVISYYGNCDLEE